MMMNMMTAATILLSIITISFESSPFYVGATSSPPSSSSSSSSSASASSSSSSSSLSSSSSSISPSSSINDKQSPRKSQQQQQQQQQQQRHRVLIIDVDNCLYDESALLQLFSLSSSSTESSSSSSEEEEEEEVVVKVQDKGGIESQIIQGIHKFGKNKLDLSLKECDELHYKYGSTIEGICHERLYKNLDKQLNNNKMNDNDNIELNNDESIPITSKEDDGNNYRNDEKEIYNIQKYFYQEAYANVDPFRPLLHIRNHHHLRQSSRSGDHIGDDDFRTGYTHTTSTTTTTPSIIENTEDEDDMQNSNEQQILQQQSQLRQRNLNKVLISQLNERMKRTKTLLTSASKNPNVSLYLASNSPLKHVRNVLSALGLNLVNVQGILTPDSERYYEDDEDRDDNEVKNDNNNYRKSNKEKKYKQFPTKAGNPKLFYQEILNKYLPSQTNSNSISNNNNDLIIIDDSRLNIEKAQSVGIHKGLRVNLSFGKSGKRSRMNLDDAISIALGHVPPLAIAKHSNSQQQQQQQQQQQHPTNNYQFNDVNYLTSKNNVDKISIHQKVWNKMGIELRSRRGNGDATTTTLRIVDLGAGILNMLGMVLNGSDSCNNNNDVVDVDDDGNDNGVKKENTNDYKKSLLDLAFGANDNTNDERSSSSSSSLSTSSTSTATTSTLPIIQALGEVEYVAYEPNIALLEACREKLKHLGFVEYGDDDNDVGGDNVGDGGDGATQRRFIFRKTHILFNSSPSSSSSSSSYSSSSSSSSSSNNDDDNDNDTGNSITNKRYSVEVTVDLRLYDFRHFDDNHQQKSSSTSPPDLIIGCCFADLFNPNDLASSIHRFLHSSSTSIASSTTTSSMSKDDTLLYLPITHTGVTTLEPSLPYDGNIPSDSYALNTYSKILSSTNVEEGGMGHCLDYNRIIQAFQEEYGGTNNNKSSSLVLEKGTSDWIINFRNNNYLWETLFYFFGKTICPKLDSEGWNSAGWIERARFGRGGIDGTGGWGVPVPTKNMGGEGEQQQQQGFVRPTIRATNIDILMVLPLLPSSLYHHPSSITSNIQSSTTITLNEDVNTDNADHNEQIVVVQEKENIEELEDAEEIWFTAPGIVTTRMRFRNNYYGNTNVSDNDGSSDDVDDDDTATTTTTTTTAKEKGRDDDASLLPPGTVEGMLSL